MLMVSKGFANLKPMIKFQDATNGEMHTTALENIEVVKIPKTGEPLKAPNKDKDTDKAKHNFWVRYIHNICPDIKIESEDYYTFLVEMGL